MPFITTPREAEINAALHMQRLGYADAYVTSIGPDGGVDVRSISAIAQVKWQGSQVGRPALQRLIGARGHQVDLIAIFYTGSSYSRHALEYADLMGMAVFTYQQDGSVYPSNGVAVYLASASVERQADIEKEQSTPAAARNQERAIQEDQQRLWKRGVFVVNPGAKMRPDATFTFAADNASFTQKKKHQFMNWLRKTGAI